MRNLAGNEHCDEYIQKELRSAGIRLVRGEKQDGEVHATVTGALGAFKFFRKWSYWSVEGYMPLEVAKELYEDPVGKADVRAMGHAGCPPPEAPWIEWYDSEGRRIFPLSKRPKGYFGKGVGYQMFFKDPSKVGKGYITLYHIDTQEGLNLFADAIRKHQLF